MGEERSITNVSNHFQSILSKWGRQTGSQFAQKAGWEGVDVAAFSGLASDGVTSWSSFKGFYGGVFDGRYVYTVPLTNGSSSGKIARFDTQGSFSSAAGWQGVDIAAFSGTATDGVTPWSNFKGFTGGVFDGRYVYIPGGGKIARYDTQLSFANQSSWQGLSVTTFTGVSTDGVSPWADFGNLGRVNYDGRYLYVTSYSNSAGMYIAKYDTQQVFAKQPSWEGLYLGNFAGNASDGITPWASFGSMGATAFDGRYLYWGSYFVGTNYIGKILKFDTKGALTSQPSWQGMDFAQFTGISSDGVTPWSSFNGFIGGGFDGRYVYMIPFANTGSVHSGKIARYDIQGNLNSQSSWQGQDIALFPGTATDGVTLWSTIKGFGGSSFDGRYLYFIPTRNVSNSGKIARFDTQGNFNSSTSWDGVNIAAFTGNATDGVTPWTSFTAFAGSAFDGRYVYLVPYGFGTSGKVARFDTSSNTGAYQLSYSSYSSDGLGGALPGTAFTINTATGTLNLSSAAVFSSYPGWHHVAATYDSNDAKLYVDGNLVVTQPATGFINSSTSDLSIGSLGGAQYLNGALENIQLYNRSLTSLEVQSLANCFR